MTHRATNLLYRFLDTNGDGTGTKNANGNYLVSPNINTEFFCTATEFIKINRLIINVQDSTGMDVAEYGTLGTALTTGYTFKVITDNDTEILDLCDDLPIKTNGGLGHYCYDVDVKAWGVAPSDDYLSARWTFTKAGAPLVLEPGWRFSVTLNDDLSGLVGHYFMLQGIKEGERYRYV